MLPVDQKSCGRCAQVLENEDEYVVERIIGKRTVVSEEAPHTSRDEYLVKWEGGFTTSALASVEDEFDVLL